MSNEIQPTEEQPKKVWMVPVQYIKCGYVKVAARGKNEANAVISQMDRKKLRSYFKEQGEFTRLGEAFLPDDD